MKQRFTTATNEARAGAGTQSIARALDLLKAFDDAHAEWGLSEVATAVGLHKTTVFRLFGALERAGFVGYDPARQSYRLGPELIRLGRQAMRSTDLHAASHAVLEELARETGETATLEVLVGDEVLILDEVQGRYLLRPGAEIGMRFSAHATSTGKVLLAAARFEQPLGETPSERPRPAKLRKLGPNTITTRARLDRELALVWQRGYAVAREESEQGYVAVGAPVRNASGRCIAAVSVGGLVSRMPIARTKSIAHSVCRSAARISQQLGAPTVTLPPRRR